MFTFFPVFLDACTLVPNWLRDLLLVLSEEQLFRPLWSETVLDEMERTLVGKLGVPADRAAYTRDKMQRSFPEASVTGHQQLIAAMPINEKDRHVLAAAVCGHAQLIVTANLKDFPADTLKAFCMEALTPDGFLIDLLARYPQEVFDALQFVSDQTGRAEGKPLLTVYQLLQALGRVVPNFAAAVLIQFEIA